MWPFMGPDPIRDDGMLSRGVYRTSLEIQSGPGSSFSLYNSAMKDIISARVAQLSEEIDALVQEQQFMKRRDQEIEVRLHQLVGAVYELQLLLTHPDRQPSGWKPDPFEGIQVDPSVASDLDIHQEPPIEIETSNQQPS